MCLQEAGVSFLELPGKGGGWRGGGRGDGGSGWGDARVLGAWHLTKLPTTGQQGDRGSHRVKRRP